jgi:periplasmic protein TonB
MAARWSGHFFLLDKSSNGTSLIAHGVQFFNKEGHTVFQETLLESSAQTRRGKRWPMATAFLLEIAAAAALVAVPLLGAKIVPVLADVHYYRPTPPVPLANKRPKPSPAGTGSGQGSSRRAVVSLLSCSGPNCITIGKPPAEQVDSEEPPNLRPGGGDGGPDLMRATSRQKPVGPAAGRLRFSSLSEALLVKKVEPAYPHIAVVTGISGIVKLHAIIAKDGSIQSLNVISGHPLLARAAVEAVEQWRYRPYRLNGEAVEVETFITVNFKREK